MICPRCLGEQVVHGFVCGPNVKCKPVTQTCYQCRGTGEITDEMGRWIAEGDKLREARMRADYSLREAASHYGVPVVEWSDAEHGRRDPAPYLAMAVRRPARRRRDG